MKQHTTYNMDDQDSISDYQSLETEDTKPKAVVSQQPKRNAMAGGFPSLRLASFANGKDDASEGAQSAQRSIDFSDEPDIAQIVGLPPLKRGERYDGK